MKNSTKSLVWAALIVAVALVACLVLNRNSADREQSSEVRSVSNAPAAKLPTELPASSPPLTPIKPLPSGYLQKSNNIKALIDQKNSPIVFWGKTEDQNGHPLAEVKVTATIRKWAIISNETPFSVFSQTNITTQGDGIFEIQGMRGDSLQIKAVEKDGYQIEPTAPHSFSYNSAQNAISSETSPIVFRMFKNEADVALRTMNKTLKITPDGRTYAIDLLDGTIKEATNSEGDLKFWVERPQGVNGPRPPFDWSFGISSQSGGIVEVADRDSSVYRAPDNGYTTSYEFKRRASDNGWGSDSGDVEFYVKTRGNYGRVRLNVDSYFTGNISGFTDGDGMITIHSKVNPSGSQDLR